MRLRTLSLLILPLTVLAHGDHEHSHGVDDIPDGLDNRAFAQKHVSRRHKPLLNEINISTDLTCACSDELGASYRRIRSRIVFQVCYRTLLIADRFPQLFRILTRFLFHFSTSLHDLNNDGFLDIDEIEAIYGLHHPHSMKHSSPESQDSKRQVVTEKVLEVLDTNGDSEYRTSDHAVKYKGIDGSWW